MTTEALSVTYLKPTGSRTSTVSFSTFISLTQPGIWEGRHEECPAHFFSSHFIYWDKNPEFPESKYQYLHKVWLQQHCHSLWVEPIVKSPDTYWISPPFQPQKPCGRRQECHPAEDTAWCPRSSGQEPVPLNTCSTQQVHHAKNLYAQENKQTEEKEKRKDLTLLTGLLRSWLQGEVQIPPPQWLLSIHYRTVGHQRKPLCCTSLLHEVMGSQRHPTRPILEKGGRGRAAGWLIGGQVLEQASKGRTSGSPPLPSSEGQAVQNNYKPCAWDSCFNPLTQTSQTHANKQGFNFACTLRCQLIRDWIFNNYD